jgi:hypothetical protein
MSGLALRALAHVHGNAGWLSALALGHPALLLRRGRRRPLGVAWAATGLVTAVAALGAVLYPRYRTLIKPALFATAPIAGELFERKEHLGVLAVVLAWTGLALCRLAARRTDEQVDIARAAFVAYTGATLAALASATTGLVVGVCGSF